MLKYVLVITVIGITYVLGYRKGKKRNLSIESMEPPQSKKNNKDILSPWVDLHTDSTPIPKKKANEKFIVIPKGNYMM